MSGALVLKSQVRLDPKWATMDIGGLWAFFFSLFLFSEGSCFLNVIYITFKIFPFMTWLRPSIHKCHFCRHLTQAYFIDFSPQTCPSMYNLIFRYLHNLILRTLLDAVYRNNRPLALIVPFSLSCSVTPAASTKSVGPLYYAIFMKGRMMTRDGLSSLWNEMIRDGELTHRNDQDHNIRWVTLVNSTCVYS